MIKHIAVFRWTAEATPEQKELVTTELRGLRPLMTGACSYSVGADAGLVRGDADFAVADDFKDAASYLTYRDHPPHRAVMPPHRAVIPPHRAVIPPHRAVIEQTIQPIVATRHSIQYKL